MDKMIFDLTWDSLLLRIKEERCKVPYSGLIIAGVNFDPFLTTRDCDLIVLAVMLLLFKYAYTTNNIYGKFTIGYIMRMKSSEVLTFTIGKAYTFRENGIDQPVYAWVEQLVMAKAEEYDNCDLYGVFLNIYLLDDSVENKNINYTTDAEIACRVWDSMNSKKNSVRPKEVLNLKQSKRSYSEYITALKPSKRPRQPFIVADTETILVNDVHVPYAVGFLVVRPGQKLSSSTLNSIETYYSEDYPEIVFNTFQSRSKHMIFNFIERLTTVVRHDPSIKIVYFHNFSRFDGIILLKYLASHGKKYKFKTFMRNNMLYEISFYHGKKLLFRLRDSLRLLPNSLNSLARNICPELGSKLVLEHNKVNEDNLIHLRQELIHYMKQDILLLGGVMLKVQELYWSLYNVDIVSKITLSSLALAIFRTRFYDEINWPIYIPNKNAESFIRKGYYGGHADSYIPYGEDLYYYDINSLYPFIMKNYPMPGGKPVWYSNLQGQDINNLFGFIEAYVECPPNIERPFLPYRDKNNTLIFPTGIFVGVYYSEELKFARNIGYSIMPLSGYLFENKNSSPFGSFVSTIFEKRNDAKKTGNDALSYVYKILMNSLYGRFGINPKCTITEVCDLNRYKILTKSTDFIKAEKISEDYYLVVYWINTDNSPDSEWGPPRVSAVQISAAITACSRIHMYPYISRPDCYYTDTDSVVLANPLPDDVISQTELGKFKLEFIGKKNYFLAPKCYCIVTTEDLQIIKHKGIGKSIVNEEWFETQYADISRIKITPVVSNFKIDWNKLDITKKKTLVSLGIKESNKRIFIYQKNQWVGTIPINVTDYAGKEKKVLEYKVMHLKKEIDKYRESLSQKDSLIRNIESKTGK